jgi:hypothetical protein
MFSGRAGSLEFSDLPGAHSRHWALADAGMPSSTRIEKNVDRTISPDIATGFQ